MLKQSSHLLTTCDLVLDDLWLAVEDLMGQQACNNADAVTQHTLYITCSLSKAAFHLPALLVAQFSRSDASAVAAAVVAELAHSD